MKNADKKSKNPFKESAEQFTKLRKEMPTEAQVKELFQKKREKPQSEPEQKKIAHSQNPEL